MNRPNQNTIIKDTINYYLDTGITDKHLLYAKVADELNVPRPTVRRVARNLRIELQQKIQVLQSNTPDGNNQKKK